MKPSPYAFDPRDHEHELTAIIRELRELKPLDRRSFDKILRRYPRDGKGAFSKSQIIRGFRFLAPLHGWTDEVEFVRRLRMKPIRTQSGVAPVTVLTKPYPCPGKCIFCPNDVRMPKSYLSREPGAQRAAQHDFDPYGQTYGRLLAFHHTGHEVDKVELIILGGTWSFYPEAYQIWFLKRCFDAMNDFATESAPAHPDLPRGKVSFLDLDDEIDGRAIERTYNQVISNYLNEQLAGRLIDRSEEATWNELFEVQRLNETRRARCVGLVVETRPDHLSREEVERIRRLGATKVQIGYQSLSDEVLKKNNRGHDVAATRRAMRLLRQAGFKIHAHWMPNLYGSNPQADIEDFKRLFDDRDFRPDELKIYPCSLIESAELMTYYEDGRWQPYTEEELLQVVTECMLRVPPYCRVTRVIRDIPGDDIMVGNKITNFRELAEKDLRQRGLKMQDIRAREIRNREVRFDELELQTLRYESAIGEEVFLQFVTPDDDIVGFCRLSLPSRPVFLGEINHSAMIREVHVYGAVVALGDSPRGETARRSQHSGLGRRLVEEAARLATERGFSDLAVISSIGTREYYRGLGFRDQELYQHRALAASTEALPQAEPREQTHA